MLISELISILEQLMKDNGNIEVRKYDNYEASEGWGENEVWSTDLAVCYCENESLNACDNTDAAPRATFIGIY